MSRPNDLKREKSLHGLTRTLIHNMVEGVSNGFSKTLEVNGVGYRAVKQGKKLTLSLGYSHPVEMEDPEGIETKVDGNKIIVSGVSKEKVGQYAAEIREKRKPEPYKGKGIKYETEVIRRKVGKTGKIRNRISGTASRPRLAVYRSNKNMYAQIIDDETGATLVSANTLQKDVKESLEKTDDVEAAKAVGTAIAKRALEKGIKEVVFDRAGYIYHGKVQALADAAREAGLDF